MKPKKSHSMRSGCPSSAPNANPFETLVMKRKHSVLNQAPSSKHPGQLQKKAYDTRSETLGKEFALSHKTNRFVDGRANYIPRYRMASNMAQTREMFNLNLTHRGQMLHEIESLDHVPDGFDDDEGTNGMLPDSFTSETHFGGGPVDDRSGKERKTVIEEMIACYKQQKAARQQDNDEVYAMRQKLDEDLDDLMPFLNEHFRKDIVPIKPDGYDRMVREMIFAPRGEPAMKRKCLRGMEQKKDVTPDANQHESADAMFEEYLAGDSDSEINTNDETIPGIESIELDATIPKQSNESNPMNLPRGYDQFAQMLDSNNLLDGRIALLEGMIRTLAEKTFLPKSRWTQLFAYSLRYIEDRLAQAKNSSITNEFKTLHLLTPLLHDMAHKDPSGVGKLYLELLQEKYTEFNKRPQRYPGVETLVLLKLVPVLFPASDRRNSIVNVALIFIGKILTRCPVRDRRDITRGLLLVTTILECSEQSKRFLPFVAAFLTGLLGVACPKGSLALIPAIRQPFQLSLSLLLPSGLEDVTENSTELQLTAEDLLSSGITPSFKMRATACTVQLAGAFCKQIEHLEVAPIFAKHFLHLLQIIPKNACPPPIQQIMQKTIEKLTDLSKRSLSYLVKKETKPKLSRLLEPKISPIYMGVQRSLKMKEPVGVQRRKLQQKMTRAARTAKREIRLDNEYVAKLRQKVRLESDRERIHKVRRIVTNISSQQAELKLFDRKLKLKK